MKASSSLTPQQATDIERMARSTIILSLGDSVIREVAKEKTVVDLWIKLETIYMIKSLTNRLHIKKRMFTLKMAEGSSLDDHIDEFNRVCDTLETIDERLSDESKAMLLVSSLPQSYSNIVDALMYGRQTLSLDEVKAALNTRGLQEKSVSIESGVGLTVKWKFEKNKNAAKNQKQSKPKTKPKDLKCFHCHKEGHFKNDCPDLKNKNNKRIGNATTIEEDDGYESEDLDGGRVMMGNNTVCKVIGIGKIHLKLHDGSIKEIRQVRHIPELKRNLISLGMMDQMGCIIKLESGVLKILNGSTLVMKGTRKNGVYVLDEESVTWVSNAIESTAIDKTTLWHLRLGHMSIKGLKELKKQGVLGSDTIEELVFCKECILGKSTRNSFKKSIHKTTEILQYIHSDLWGPSQISFLGGNRYFMTMIDDYSRRVWVYVLKSKDQVFGKFKEWKALVENQTEKRVKKLTTDNGLEYCNQEFDSFCANEGIARHRTVRLTPQQNGLAERMNKTLMDKVRCMMIQSQLPKGLWTETLLTAYLLVNLSPSAGIDFKTPLEIWYGKPDGVKGYKLWCTDLSPPRCIISRAVIFNEEIVLRKKPENNDAEPQDETLESIQFEVEHPNKKSSQEAADSDGDEDDSSRNIEAQSQQHTPTQLRDYHLARDREMRQIRPLQRYGYADLIIYALAASHEIDKDEPTSYREAMKSSYKSKWQRAMDDEIDSLYKNNTWELVKKPEKRRIMGCKWIFKLKEGLTVDEPKRFKARLVAKGYTQKEGFDFKEVFSPVIRHVSIRVLLALTVVYDMELGLLDVKITFLHGRLQEEILMTQPERFVCSEYPDHVCLLKKSLYGLKQSLREWYLRFGTCQEDFGHGNHKRQKEWNYVLVLEECPKASEEKQEMSKVHYANTVGCMMYAIVLTRPNISHALSLISRYMASPGKEHWKAAKWVLRRRSQTGYMFMLNGCLISWKASLQHVVALSTTEAEYTAASAAVKEALWLKGLISELGISQKVVDIHCDSSSAIYLSRNLAHHKKTKHIDIKLHFIRNVISKGVVKMVKIHTSNNLADMLTKVVPTAKLKTYLDITEICSL
ncbi:Integrase catalytic domain-containing protein [Citrus sinensis]|uniref:Integrase catalytic domain-containing protein n=1 Tax=Citrus sinensis TaxID=2711 RepID=A0ACB8L9Y6_CITSI|nr:Integrase catalytic domain-containing protein [Citrus sinensis]